MDIKKFDEALINKDYIALYAYPDDNSVCKIPKNCDSRYLGPLPTDQLEFKYDGKAKDFGHILLPALNAKGAKAMRKEINQLSTEYSTKDVYRNEDALNTMDYDAEHYPYLTSRLVGFYDTDTEEGLIAQDESKHLDFDDANLASIDLDDNPSDVGSDGYTRKYLSEDVKDSPHDVEYIINYNVKPIIADVGYSDPSILVGYEVTNERNGMTIACANNEANRIKIVKLLTKKAPEYLKSFYDAVKKNNSKVAE